MVTTGMQQYSRIAAAASHLRRKLKEVNYQHFKKFSFFEPGVNLYFVFDNQSTSPTYVIIEYND